MWKDFERELKSELLLFFLLVYIDDALQYLHFFNDMRFVL